MHTQASTNKRYGNKAAGTIYSRFTAINVPIKNCTYCGKRNVSQCGLRTHPDANDDTTIEWSDSKIGKAIIAADGGKGRLRCSEKKLERLVANEILKSVPP